MDARAIAFAIPVFFLLIGIEALLTRRRGPLAQNYRFADAVTSLSCGIGQQVLGLLFGALKLLGYVALYEYARVWTIDESSVVAWIALLFAVDFLYWVYHWASHRVNFLWATHAVHHQSEEYNLTTALRQSWFTQFTSWVFYLPLAIIGFPPLMFVLMTTLNTLYQFWIHTRLVGTMGVLEHVLNTPSHHRVHHGINPKYIDKNYAGIFIIWDKLFGTFSKEDEEPVYGTVKPLSSWNPLWANIEPFVYLARESAKTSRFIDKVRIWIAPPEWKPQDLGGPVTIPEIERSEQVRYETETPPGVATYVGVSFALVTVAVTALLWFKSDLSVVVIGVATLLIMMTVIGWGGLFERRRWAVPLEVLKTAGVIGGAAYLAGPTTVTFALVMVGSIALLGWLIATRRADTTPATNQQATA